MSHLEQTLDYSDCHQQVDADISEGRCQQSEYRCDTHAYAIHSAASKPAGQPATQDLSHDVAVEKGAEDQTLSLGVPVEVSRLHKVKLYIL